MENTVPLPHGKYIETIGRRKSAIARVRFFTRGEGEFLVNGQPLKSYFPTFQLSELVIAPLTASELTEKGTFNVRVTGGGKRGQADAIRLGVARALVKWNESLRKKVKPLGYLTRDARVKERKKPGLKRARRAPQWQKR